ncbi:DUF7024 domain-containing protein, partial [Escherichia coli]|uniref:DUF7024 domain-containing protein n=1 Tax=Escherichia coli TaxID=562 RepID=UPI00165368E4
WSTSKTPSYTKSVSWQHHRRPIPVRVGNEEQTLVLGNEVTTTTLHFDNPTDADTLVIVPPEPVSTNEGNILGHSPRKLGIGMVEIKVVEREG